MVENTHQETATGRLYLLMTHLREFADARPNTAMLEAFSGYFATAANEWTKLLPLIGAAARLPELADAEVSEARADVGGPRLAVSQERFTEACNAARQVFVYTGQMSNTAAEAWKGIITERALSSLEFTSEALWQRLGDPVVSGEDLAALRAAAQAFVEAILEDPSLDVESRRLLLNHAHALRDSVDHYRSEGFAGLENWQASFIGSLALHPEVQEVVDSKPTLLERIADISSTITVVATAAHATFAAGGDPVALMTLVLPAIEQGSILRSLKRRAIEAPRNSDETK